MVERLIHKADFESLMSAPTWSRSAHFALHYLSRGPATAPRRDSSAVEAKISTELDSPKTTPVDKMLSRSWLGAMVPKRHARRAVTRNLIKRQIRAVFERHEAALPHGLWLVRLRRVFPPSEFISARSTPLAETARRELEELLRRARGGRIA